MAKLTPPILLALLAFLALASMVAFMTIGANGHWDFVLSFRSGKLAAMLLVAYCVAVSSVLFQTITHNRILTPSIMGFDELYRLIQSIGIFWFGMNMGGGLDATGQFLLEVGLMTLFSCLLFQWIFSGGTQSLHLLLLVGIVFGLLFRSLSGLMVRLIDPNEFLFLQDKMFASFNAIRTNLLLISAILVGVTSIIGWRLRRVYDVLALGREVAINLGIHYRKAMLLTLVLISVMVSVSTALVGPVTFFGLLVSNLAYMIMQTDKHKFTVPAAILLGIVALVGGQTLLEHALALNTTVSVVIEFAGGLMFIALIVRRGQK